MTRVSTLKNMGIFSDYGDLLSVTDEEALRVAGLEINEIEEMICEYGHTETSRETLREYEQFKKKLLKKINNNKKDLHEDE